MKRLITLLLAAIALPSLAATSIQTNSGNFYSNGTLTNGVYADAKIRLTFDKFTWTSATVGTNTDLSGNGNHAGTGSGINRTNSAVPSLRGQGIRAQPSASGGYLQCRSDATIDDLQLQGGGGMTIEWTMCGVGAPSGSIAAKGSGSGRWDIGYSVSTAPFMVNFTKSCATTAFVENYAYLFFSNRWYHCVLTWDGGIVTNSTKLYINGQRQLSTSVTTGVGAVNSDAANNLTLLNTPGGTAGNVQIGDFAAWARILSQEEITTLCDASRANGQFPVESTGNINMTNILDFEGVANGTVFDTTLMGTGTKGAAGTTRAITGAAADWTVVGESNMTALNPIVVAGTTYAAQSNTIACRIATGLSSSLDWTLPTTYGGQLSGCFSFKTELRSIASSAVTYDFFNVGAIANSAVFQVSEGSGGYKIGCHTINDGVSVGGAYALTVPYQWYDFAWRWDTNNGLFHGWIYDSVYNPSVNNKRRLILYTYAPIHANSNATFLGPCNNPHGATRSGLTNYWRFFSWSYSNQTNAPLIALMESPFAIEPKRMFAWNETKRWELPQFDLVLRKEWE